MAVSAPFLLTAKNDNKEWRDYLNRFPEEMQDVYYLPDYYLLNEQAGFGHAECFVYTEDDKVFFFPYLKNPIAQIAGVVVDEGFYDFETAYGYGGPICNNRDPGFCGRAYRAFESHCRDSRMIAGFIRFHPVLKNYELFKEVMEVQFNRHTVEIPTDVDEKFRWEKIYTHANRKNINKAKRNKLEVVDRTEEKYWSAFRGLYEATMVENRAAGFYHFNETYFRLLREKLGKNIKLFSVLSEGEPIAAILFLLGKKYCHSHLLGSNRDFLGTGSNNYLHHEVLLWAKEKRYDSLHLGGGRTTDPEDPLLRFKKNYSGKLLDFYIGKSIFIREKYEEYNRIFVSRTAHPESYNGFFLKYRQPRS